MSSASLFLTSLPTLSVPPGYLQAGDRHAVHGGLLSTLSECELPCLSCLSTFPFLSSYGPTRLVAGILGI